ncbi:hypothetical protein Cni_G23638 [Canna indica]|uniref:Exocyst subunit Exo70 family protein n=1 Tax=Canna indica TaxID=4628 RepID=A0AAQ3KWL4_9LILI|nr:hypothetical protein Cni_G23638 [Canna indica]
MTRKGLRRFVPSYSFGRHHHDRQSSGGSAPASSPRSPQQRLSDALMEDHVAAAEAIVVKWDPDASSHAKRASSLFHDDRAEARDFLAAVRDLQCAMLFFVSGGGAVSSSHATIVRAQTLMQAAMRRLEKEFYQILAANRDFFEPESVSARSCSRFSASDEGDDDEVGGGAEDSAGEIERAGAMAMADLRAIAETMIAAGYGKECVKVYKVLRKSVVDEGLYRLGFAQLSASQVHKLDWAVLEIKIRSWLRTSRVAVATLFSRERILMDHVFGSSDSIREAVFADIAGETALQFLRFPESVAKSKRSTEKLVRFLDLREAISEILLEVESVFSFESTAAVREQAVATLAKLAEAVRATIADFEAALQKEHSKSLVPGGRVHPLTRDAMNCIATLADYETTLAEVFADFPLPTPNYLPGFLFGTSNTAAQPSSPASSLSSSSSFSSSSSTDNSRRTKVTALLAGLLLVLLCKLDAKARAYRDAGLSYLFLANNLQYIVSRVQSCRLREVLGEEWAARHAAKARQHAAAYERVAWAKVAAEIPVGKVGAGEARERMLAFSTGLEEACAAQAGWVVADEGMREEVRASVRGMVLPAYRSFYKRWRAVPEFEACARFSPEEVEGRLGELFSGSEDGAGSVSFTTYKLGSDSGSVDGGSVKSDGSSRSM